jgi:mRNA-degrading endonuclease toxin of MazEF toxin-antitoxin module
MALSRGAIVVVASRGAYTGQPRPALIVQSDLFNETHWLGIE